MNPFIKTFVAATAIAHRQLVVFTANDGEVTVASATTDTIAGVADFPSGAKAGDRVDVVIFGPAEVIAGGAIAPGKSFSAGADGKAVAATTTGNVTGGHVLTGAASGDFVRAFIQRGSFVVPA